MSAIKAHSESSDVIESVFQPAREWWDVMSKTQNFWLGRGAGYANWQQAHAALRTDGASMNALLNAQIKLVESLLQFWLASLRESGESQK